MAANEINMKQISEDLKSFLTKKMENNPKKITEKIIEKMNSNFDELSTRIETIDRKVEAAETLAKENQKNISNLTCESTALQEKLAEQAKKIHELEENIEDQVNRNSRVILAIRGIKRIIKRKHGIILHMCTPVPYVDCLDGIQISSSVTLKEHRGDYKNPNSSIYVKFISWKVSQAVLDSIIKANRSRQTSTSASQKYSDKVHKRMNRLLIT